MEIKSKAHFSPVQYILGLGLTKFHCKNRCSSVITEKDGDIEGNGNTEDRARMLPLVLLTSFHHREGQKVAILPPCDSRGSCQNEPAQLELTKGFDWIEACAMVSCTT